MTITRRAPASRTRLLAQRLRSHRLSAPAATVAEAADHMLAVQAQEFWGGRWALAARTRGAPTLADVDALFDAGRLVRSWTMRGTIHIVPARDLPWMLSVTGARQLRAAAGRQRQLGLDEESMRRAETAAVAALRGGGRLNRAELFEVFSAAGVDPGGQRGYHLLYALGVRGVLCQGPVVRREGAIAREQCFVLVDKWVTDAVTPPDPLVELFVRYIDGHGPADAGDFAWWSGLPLSVARQAAAASAGRLVEVDEDVFVARDLPRSRPRAPSVLALPSFDEYYLSYLDRSRVCAPDVAAVVGPAKNGMVRPIVLARGAVAGVWAHSKAVGRHADDPVPELLVPDAATDAEVAAALERYARFITG
nr:winged helix DNA-binding domain-containing protein [Microbacterium bovistercoris]